MNLRDLKIVYDFLNFNNAEYIDFKKFCFINDEKPNNIQYLIEEKKKYLHLQNDEYVNRNEKEI